MPSGSSSASKAAIASASAFSRRASYCLRSSSVSAPFWAASSCGAGIALALFGSFMVLVRCACASGGGGLFPRPPDVPRRRRPPAEVGRESNPRPSDRDIRSATSRNAHLDPNWRE